MTAPPRGNGGLLGARVVDREDAPNKRNPIVVVNTPPVPSSNWEISKTGRTVAEGRRNEEYPDDAEIAVGVFEDVVKENDLDASDVPLSLASLDKAGIKFYAFPAPRLKAVGSAIDGEEIRRVDPANIKNSWCHGREFDADAKSEFIRDVRDQGTLGSVLTARETTGGIELVDGHFRRWLAECAGLDDVPVRVLDLDDQQAASHYAKAHNTSVEDLPPPPEDVPESFKELEERLADVADVCHERANGGTPVLAVEKLGQRYLVTPDGTVHGDGALLGRIESVVNEVVG